MLLLNALESFSISVSHSALLAIASVIVVHLVYKKYEPDPTAYLPTFILLGVIPCISSTLLVSHFSSSIAAYSAGVVVFYASLLSSIAIYRISPWHPLAGYPGPKLARLSNFWLVRVAQTGKQHIALKDLHDQYGPLVRIGPNELSIADLNLVSKIIGYNGMPKGPFMDGIRKPDEPPDILVTRNIADHTQKRKPWTRAFSAPAIRDFGPTIARRALQLAEELEKYASTEGDTEKAVNLSTWMSYFSFDIMGDKAFGGGFELMREGDVEGIWKMLAASMRARIWMGRIPWTARLVHKIPMVARGVAKFRKFTMNCALRRKARGTLVRDVFYHIANEDDEEEISPPLDLVLGSCEVAIIAGSDTTSATLSGVFYHLLVNPDIYKRLQKEIDDTFPAGEGDALDMGKLSELTFLNAVINETARLQPAVPVLQRAPAIGSGGYSLGEYFIPEGTAVCVSLYTLHRNPDYFSPTPDKFWPDRWLQSSNEAKTAMTPEAFLPFSTGPASCVGKSLALAEMRAVVALLMQRFEMRLAEEYNPQQWEDDLEDSIVFKVGNLPVVLELRK